MVAGKGILNEGELHLRLVHVTGKSRKIAIFTVIACTTRMLPETGL